MQTTHHGALHVDDGSTSRLGFMIGFVAALLVFPFLLRPVSCILGAQVLPDRIVMLDPLADRAVDTAGTTWLNGARMYAEFGRYVSGDADHRWNAKIGGVAEIVRWDSSADISIVGTMEVVIDPNNDITFNPRAIFWEEGVLAGFRLGDGIGLQAGYVHRCKHDIDNLEITLRGDREQRTLIYSGVLTRLLFRPRAIVDDTWRIDVSGAVRNDFFLHLLDDRIDAETRGVGTDLESLVDAVNIVARIEARPRDARWRVHASANFMASLFGAQPGFSERFTDMFILGSLPYAELGLDFFNPAGSTFTFFVRAESYRDAGVSTLPKSAAITSVGVRIADSKWMW